LIRLTTIFLVFALLLQPISKLWVLLAFQVQRDYIAKEICINRTNPQSDCKGLCYLKNQLRLVEDKHKKFVELCKQVEATVIFVQPLPKITLPTHYEVVIPQKFNIFFHHYHPSSIVEDIFHPPIFLA
jgi:hypothetical protein